MEALSVVRSQREVLEELQPFEDRVETDQDVTRNAVTYAHGLSRIAMDKKFGE